MNRKKILEQIEELVVDMSKSQIDPETRTALLNILQVMRNLTKSSVVG